MTVTLNDRPIEAVREEVIDKLIYHYSHGVISADAFERRLDAAMASQEHQEIVDLATDLTMDVDNEYTREKEQKLNINYAHGYSDSDAPESETIVNVMGGSDRSGHWQVPKEIRVLCVMGGADIDFSDAIFTSPNVTVRALCVMGGVDIKVPENVNVITKAFCFMGGVDNTAPSIADRQAPTITIEGFVMMGGIEVGLKRTIKEKFVAMANQMKTMFNSSKTSR